MKTMRISVPFLVLSFLATPLLHAQDFSKYRSFALGTNLATVLKNTDQKLADVRVTHTGSVLFQELTWWPANRSGAPTALRVWNRCSSPFTEANSTKCP